MIRLREQDAAAVPHQGAASGLVVITLRAPPRHRKEARLHTTEFTPVQCTFQPHAGRAKAMLQDDAEPATGGARELHQLLGAWHRQLQGLFDQHVLARRQTPLRYIQMTARRRENDDGVY